MGNCCTTEGQQQGEITEKMPNLEDPDVQNATSIIQNKWKQKREFKQKQAENVKLDSQSHNKLNTFNPTENQTEATQGHNAAPLPSIYGGNKISTARSESIKQNPSGGNEPHPEDASPISLFPDMSSKLKIIHKKLKATNFDDHIQPADKNLSELGPYKYKREEVYQGQYKNGKRQGLGKQIWSDSTYYEGTWHNDMADGYGFLIHDTGDYYIGDWKAEKAHGYGEYTSIDGAV